jgi:hypothetical protein
MEGCCIHGNEPSGFINVGGFLEFLLVSEETFWFMELFP